MSQSVFRAIFVAFTLSCFAAGAAAAESGPPGIAVPHGDLDLQSESGAREMLRRIRDAAKRICTPEPGSMMARSPRFLPAVRDCVTEAVEEAVARLDAPYVTALHESRLRQPRRLTERVDSHG